MKQRLFRMFLFSTLLLFICILFLNKQEKIGNSFYFTDIIENSGIAERVYTNGISWVDFNNDNFDDIFLVGGTGSRLYKNINGKKFVDITEKSLIASNVQLAGIFADYDNDGCQDLFVSGYVRADRLLKGNCQGGFIDVTGQSGIRKEANMTIGVSWTDYDNDGYLDVYTASHGVLDKKTQKYIPHNNILYKNNGDGTFKDVTNEAGVSGIAVCDSPKIGVDGSSKESFQPIWFDYNNDRKIDLFIATDFGVSPLYKNNGNGTFSDVTQASGLCKKGNNMGVTTGDYDNDGYLDLFVTDVGGNFLWRNNKGKTFSLVTKEAGVFDDKYIGWGTGFIDYDNDGNLDIYVTNGSIDLTYRKRPNNKIVGVIREDKLYKNLGNQKFEDVSKEAGIAVDTRKNSSAFADFNNDGSTDIFVISNHREDVPDYKFYKNNINNNNWISLKLIGTSSNKDSIGARIIVSTPGKKQIREVQSGSSFIAQNSLWQTFGIAQANIIDKIEIKWPSGRTKTLNNIKIGQRLVIEEPNK